MKDDYNPVNRPKNDEIHGAGSGISTQEGISSGDTTGI